MPANAPFDNRAQYAYIFRFSITFLAVLGCLSGNNLRADVAWSVGAGDWTNKLNWAPNKTPTVIDVVDVNNGGTPNVVSTARSDQAFFGHSAGTIGFLLVLPGADLQTNDVHLGYSGTGNATISGGSWLASRFFVGEKNGGHGLLEIAGGTAGSNYENSIGVEAGAVGTVDVAGAAAKWTSDVLTPPLNVGKFGTGTLTISDGATVKNANGSVGFGTTGHGQVAVDAATWTNTGDLYVGNAGQGTVEIIGGSSLSAVNGHVGYASTGVGIVGVESGSKWSNSGDLTIGENGSGALNVIGATVDNNVGTLGRYNTNLAGAVTIGPGATWTNRAELYIGREGVGSLTIQDGGRVTSTSGRIAWTGINSVGAVKVDGAGSAWTNTGELFVADEGMVGDLEITGGAAVSDTNGWIGRFTKDAIGSVFVSGKAGTTPSTWTNSGTLTVGRTGKGELIVAAGGRVSNTTGSIAANSGSSGTVTIKDSGSTWTNTASLYVGGGSVAAGGAGSLAVNTGSLVTVGNTLKIWGAGVVNQQSSRLIVSSDISALPVDAGLYVGINKGNGILQLTSGSILNTDDAVIGRDAGSSGTVTVDNGTWQSFGKISIGVLGTAVLDIRNNGQVLAAGEATVGTQGKLMGTGTLEDNLQDNGTVAPGESPGTLHIKGNYTQNAPGQLEIELASTSSFDQLAVTGQARLGGTLRIVLLSGFVPAATDSFSILTASSLLGSFSDITISAGSANAGTFNLASTGTGLVLSGFKSASVNRGDFNQDGHVTTADIPAMLAALADLNSFKARNGLSDAGLMSIGDFDGSGSVTNSDINALIGLLRTGGGSESASTVPEPAALLLMCYGMLMLLTCRGASTQKNVHR